MPGRNILQRFSFPQHSVAVATGRARLLGRVMNKEDAAIGEGQKRGAADHDARH